MARFPKVAVSLLVAASIYVTGCGGGSNNPPPPPSGTTINVAFAGIAPTAIAEQIGTANWTAASVPSNQKWSFTIPEGTSRYAIAYVCPVTSTDPHIVPNNEYVFEATTLDTTTYTVACPVQLSNPSFASGSVDASAFPSTSNVWIYANFGSSQVLATGQFSVNVRPETSDIAAVAIDASNNVLGVKILCSQTVPGVVNGGNPITFQASDATASQPIAVTNDPWGNLGLPGALNVNYVTANGTSLVVNYGSNGSYSVVPPSEAQSGDYYSLQANEPNVVMAPTAWIASVQTATSPAATLALPVPMAYSAPAPAAFPVFTINYSGFAGMNTTTYAAVISWNTSSVVYVIDTVTITVVASAGFQNGANMLAIPDLTSVPGFFAPAASGTSVNWFTMVAGGTSIAWYSLAAQPGSPWYTAPPPANGSISWVQNQGTYTEPYCLGALCSQGSCTSMRV